MKDLLSERFGVLAGDTFAFHACQVSNKHYRSRIGISEVARIYRRKGTNVTTTEEMAMQRARGRLSTTAHGITVALVGV